jgi:ABC-type branched-subunit amino acid transport system substrate-binding protein
MNDNLRKWLPWILVGAVAVIIVIVIAVNSGGDDDVAATTTTAGDSTTTTVEETTTTVEGETTTTTEGETTTTAAPVEGEALKLATLLPLTGDLSPFGPGMEQAVQMAVDEANDAGGVHGESVVRDGFDTATNPDTAPSEADKIIAGGYQAEVGAASSNISLGVYEALTGSGVLMISPSNTSPQFTTLDANGLYFRTVPSDALQGEYTAALMEARGVQNLAIIYIQDSYGEGLKAAVTANFGGNVAIEAPYETTALDPAAIITTVVEASPDAVLFIGFPENAVPIHQEAFKQELLKADQSIPWFYTDGMLDPTFVEATTLDASLFTGFVGTAPGTPEGQAAEQFASRFQAATGGDFTLFAPQSYDAAWMVILASQASDGTTAGIQSAMVGVSKGGTKCLAEECLAALIADPAADIDYVGASGEIDFKDGTGDPGSALYQIWSFTADGGTQTDQLVESPADIK